MSAADHRRKRPEWIVDLALIVGILAVLVYFAGLLTGRI